MNECCQSCRFFFAPPEEGQFIRGECHRNPPIAIVSDAAVWGEFPSVHRTSWCGEWKPDEAADPKAVGA